MQSVPESYIRNSIQLGDIPSRDQGKTGRCWIEAALSEVGYLYFCKTGERLPALSSAFIGYHDLRLKVHIFLQQIYRTRELPLDDPLIEYWLKRPVQDAGQKSIFRILISRHGIVPESCVPVTKFSLDTHAMISGLNQKLRLAAYQIREEGVLPEALEEEICLLIDRCMGKMPESFVFGGTSITPLDYYREYIAPLLSFEEISIVNIPAPERPFGRFYKAEWLYSETMEDSPVCHYNAEQRYLELMAVMQLKRDHPVWIGVDAEHYADKQKGIFDTDLYHFEETEGIEMEPDKGAALLYRDSLISHALLLCGVDIENGTVRRWCVKNSFGDAAGQNGYAYMSAEWFKRYVYQIVVRKEIAEEALDLPESAGCVYLKASDPLGCLAKG